MKVWVTLCVLALALSGCAGESDEPETADDAPVENPGEQQTQQDSEETPAAAGSETEPEQEPEAGQETEAPANQAPTAALGAITVAEVGSESTFNVTVSDPDGDALNWTLDANGDGEADATGTESGTAAFTFDAEGDYEVSLNVTDGDLFNVSVISVTIVLPEPTGPCGSEPEPCVIGEDDYAFFMSDGTCNAKPDQVYTAGVIHVHERAATPGTGFLLGAGTWVYEETNDVPGLQLGGSNPAVDETGAYIDCANPDTIIF